MADDFGLKIGLEGEKEFKKALSEINQSFKVLGSEMKLATSQFEKNDNSVHALTARNQVLNKEIDAQKQKIETLRAALSNASESFGENDRRTQNWQIQLNNAEAALNGMERELAKNNEALDEAGREMDDVSTSADDMGEGIDDAADSADKSKGKFTSFAGVLKGIGVAMGTVAVAAGAAAAKLGHEVIEAYADYEQLVGGVDTLFKDSSLEMQHYAANAYKTAGLSANDYMETVTSFSASLIQSLGGNTKEAVKYANMAITDMSDNANKMGTDMSLIQNAYQGFAKQNYTMLDNLKLGYGGTRSEMERLLADAEAISGVEYNIDSYADVVEAIHVIQESMGVAGATAAEAEHTISGSINSFKASLQNMLVGFGDANADMEMLCSNMADALKNVINNVTPVIENMVKALPTVTNALLDALANLLPTLLSTVADLFSQLLNSILRVLPQLIPAAIDAVLMIVQAIIDNLPLLVEAAVQMVGALVSGIGTALPSLIPAAVAAITAIVQGLISNLPLILDAALDLIMGLADGLISAIPVLINSLPSIIQAIVEFLINSVPMIIEAGITLLTSLISALPDIIVTIVEALPQIIMAIVNTLINNIDKIIMAGVELLGALITNLPTIIAKVITAVPQIVSALVKAFADMVPQLANAGLNLIKGLWKGISDATGWIMDKIKGFCNSIVSKIKGFFGIHSPSTVFASLGGYMAEGLGVGFADEMDSVGGTMTEATATAGDMTGRAALDAIRVGLLNNIALLDEPITMLVTHIGEVFKNKLPELLAVVVKATSLMGEGITESEDVSILEPFRLMIAKIESLFNDFRGSFVKIGQRIMEGIGDGITSRSRWLNNLVTSYINEMKRRVESMLGIHSPSKVFAEIGGNIAAGMGVGFEKAMSGVRTQMERSVPTTLDAGNENQTMDIVNGLVGGLSSVMGAGNQTITLQVNLDSRTIAETIFNPLISVSRQRGVSLG